MHRYKLSIAYDGTDFSGWQSQKTGLGIEQLITDALIMVLRHPIKLYGSGRTDAGVHALCQVAHFDIPHLISPENLCYRLNSILPKTIRILELIETSLLFHARFSATKKTYYYRLHLDQIADPFLRKYTLHIPQKLDLLEMEKGAKQLLGTHDFSSFANEQHLGSAGKDPVRELYRIDFIPEEKGIRLEFEGNGFLYKMVRNITGTLIEVGLRKRSCASMTSLLLAKDRKQAGKAAEPQGLYLARVDY